MGSTFKSSRLKQAHSQVVLEINSQVDHWKKVKTDYNQLAECLTTFPDKTFHNAMVPCGPLAFMPGKLIHTNELMVHLGDTWFADVSCKQGLKIINHRLQAVDKNLEDLEKVLKNIENKSDFVEELDNTGHIPAYEIKEEVPESYVHPGRRKRISRVKSQSTEKDSKIHQKPSNQPAHDDNQAIQSCFDDEELMKRLDELEREEEKEHQMFLNESSHSSTNETETAENSSSRNKARKKVSWNAQIMEGREADSDDSDDSPLPCATIRFEHTLSDKEQGLKSEASESSQTQESSIKTPGDIGRILPSTSISDQDQVPNSINKEKSSSAAIYDHDVREKPKSILKPSSSDSTSRSYPTPKHQEAVSSIVMERVSGTTSKAKPRTISKKPVSKFKASRKR